MPPTAGRKKDVPMKIAAEAISEVFAASPTGARNEVKGEALEALALKIATYWLRAHTLKNVDTVQPLACFVDGDISLGDAGELRGPDSFNCSPNERCAAAAYIYDDKASLKKMIEALHPDNLDDVARKKNENSSRRNALKDLLAEGPMKFNKRKCRAIGDAYFSGMCPPGFALATSNSVDFEPLCNALGKKIVTP